MGRGLEGYLKGGKHLPLQRCLGSPENLQLKDTSVMKGCIQSLPV